MKKTGEGTIPFIFVFAVYLLLHLVQVSSSFVISTTPSFAYQYKKCTDPNPFNNHMNSDLAKIRRERWLQSQKRDSNDEEGKKQDSSPVLSWLDDLNSTNESERNDNTSTSEKIPVTENESTVNKQGRTVKKEGTNKVKKDCIDLTLSDSDDEVIPIGLDTKTKSATRKTVKRKLLKSKIQDKTSTAFASSSSSSSATRIAQSQNNQQIAPFSICTYNIWFGEPHQSERMARIADLISGLTPKPTFVGLQEVTPGLLRDLSPLLQSMGYRIVCQEGVAYGCAIAILTSGGKFQSLLSNGVNNKAAVAHVIDSGFQPYRMSQMSRGLMWVHARLDAVGEVLFTTTHLESYIPGNDGSEAREMQIQEASRFCLERMNQNSGCGDGVRINTAMITGDLNWDDERKRSSGTDKNLLSLIQHDQGGLTQWMDAWSETQPGQDGYTYDSKENPMLKGNLRRRFDRCLTCFRDDDVSVHTTYLIGKESMPGLQWRKEVQKWSYGKPTGETSYDMRPLAPSDHFGLVVHFGDASKKPQVRAPTSSKKRSKNDA